MSNSGWLNAFLQAKGIPSVLIYAGLDLDVFYDKKVTRDIDIGALFHKRHLTKRHIDAETISGRLKVKLEMLNKDVQSPGEGGLCNWYNRIKVWLAPTELEGFHNPPSEAGLCGCALVCSNHPRNGMSDYAINGKTALIYDCRDLDGAGICIMSLLTDTLLRKKISLSLRNKLRKDIGSRQDNIKKMLSLIRSLQ
jgi:glycosyltransferase involved in cell wall biosynthesis